MAQIGMMTMAPINMVSHGPDKKLGAWSLAKIFHGSMSKIDNTSPTSIQAMINLTIVLALIFGIDGATLSWKYE